MGKQKKNKDKKDKKKKDRQRDRERERQKDRKDKKKRDRDRDRKRSYSSSSESSSGSSSSSSSSSREVAKRKQNKNKKKQKKEVKPQIKPTNNPYDFQKTVVKPVPGFSVGIPAPGFAVPLIHATPPPPTTTPTSTVPKPKMKQIHIFKLLPKLPYGTILFAKTLYSTNLIQDKVYNKLLTDMISKVEKKVKQEGHKKGMSIIAKCIAQMQKINSQQEFKKKMQQNNQNSQFMMRFDNDVKNQSDNRFTNLKRIYDNYFQE